MDREHNFEGIPEKLLAGIAAADVDSRYRRRAVFVKSAAGWNLICCTVEAPLPGRPQFQPTASRAYKDVLLYEDLLGTEECRAFFQAVHGGTARVSELPLAFPEKAQWTCELVPIENEFMERAGLVFSARIKSDGNPSPRTLLKRGLPYYPSLDAAARDWLPFREYAGHGDGKNQQIHFLLPETRAFFSAATMSESGMLAIEVAGSSIGAVPLLLKGACSLGSELRQFEVSIHEARASVSVEAEFDWLEYFLMDEQDTVFDHHREDRYTRGSGRARLLYKRTRTLVSEVLEATEKGEGESIEFKPFTKLDIKNRAGSRDSKLSEVVKTAVSFSNTNGGRIFIGIDDDCSIQGIDFALQKENAAAVDEEAITRYVGALMNKVKEHIRGEVDLEVDFVDIKGAHVVIVTVARAGERPVSPFDDLHVYVRRGASNRKLPPEHWRSTFGEHAVSRMFSD